MIQIEPVMTRKTISTPKGEGQDVVRVIGPAPQMQKEDEVHADLSKGEHDQPGRYARGHSKLVCDTTKEPIVARIASPSSAV